MPLSAKGAPLEDGTLAWLAQQKVDASLKDNIADLLKRHGGKS